MEEQLERFLESIDRENARIALLVVLAVRLCREFRQTDDHIELTLNQDRALRNLDLIAQYFEKEWEL